MTLGDQLFWSKHIRAVVASLEKTGYVGVVIQQVDMDTALTAALCGVSSDVTLTIYAITGQQVATVVSDHQEAGHYEVRWDGSGFGNGVYLYRLEAGTFTETRRMVLMK